MKVSDEKGEYTFVDDWDIDADFDAKKRKCGINKTDDGVELCFGITVMVKTNMRSTCGHRLYKKLFRL